MEADIHGDLDGLIHLHSILHGVARLCKLVQTEERQGLDAFDHDRAIFAVPDFGEDLVDPIRGFAGESRCLRSTQTSRSERLWVGVLWMRAEGEDRSYGDQEGRLVDEVPLDPFLVLDGRQQGLERMNLFPVASQTGTKGILVSLRTAEPQRVKTHIPSRSSGA